MIRTDRTHTTSPPHVLLEQPPTIDRAALVAEHIARIRAQMSNEDIALAVLINPVNLRYAADCRNYALFQAHIPIYYLFVPISGPITMHGASDGADGIFDQNLPARGISFFNAAGNLQDEARGFADDIAYFLRECAIDSRRIAIEYVNPSLTQAMMQRGFEVLDAVGLMEKARCIKSNRDLACMRWAVRVAEEGIQRMRDALAPGVTENQLWSLLHAVNIAHDGDWMDGRMLCSGPRTNPWLQEAGPRIIEHGDLVGFDTDMVGPFGYFADISRTWRCGDGAPSATQRDLYQRAAAEIAHNMDLIRPGLSLREFSERAFVQPERFVANRYTCIAHGVGMCDEYPKVHHRIDWDRVGYDGLIEQDMVLCVESYVGATGAREGVKLEQQVRVTTTGVELLSHYPLEESWLR